MKSVIEDSFTNPITLFPLIGGSRLLPVTGMEIVASCGQLTGISNINKFGRNPDVASGTTEDIWDGSELYSWPATALMTSMSQTADQEVMRGETIEVQGLDANWDLLVQEKPLNATSTATAVALDTPLIRVFRMRVLSDEVGDSPIRVHNVGETQDYAIISIGNNQTLMAIYTVPNGKTAYMTNYYASVNPGVGAPTTLNIRLWARDNENGYASQLKHILGVNANVGAYGQFQHYYNPYKKFTQKTDIYLAATTAAAAADVSAGFDLILTDN